MVCERGGARRLWGAGAVSTVVCRAVWRERAEARVCRVCVKKTGRAGRSACTCCRRSSRAHLSHCLWLELRRLPQILSPCSFLLWILTHKRFHSNLAIAPTCDTVSTYHITDKARDPQRGLSRATYLLKVSRRAPVACRPQCRGRGRRRSKRSADQRGRSASRDGKRDGGR